MAKRLIGIMLLATLLFAVSSYANMPDIKELTKQGEMRRMFTVMCYEDDGESIILQTHFFAKTRVRPVEQILVFEFKDGEMIAIKMEELEESAFVKKNGNWVNFDSLDKREKGLIDGRMKNIIDKCGNGKRY